MIDRLNRVLVLLLAVLVVAGAVVISLAATEALDPDFLPGGSGQDAWFYHQLNGLADFGDGDLTVTLVASIAAGVLMLGVLLLEVRPLFKKRMVLLISDSPDGGSTIEVVSVRLLAERTGIVNRQVNSLHCKVRPGRRGRRGIGPSSVAIACYPRLVLGSSTEEVRDDLQTRIKESVEQLTGLNVLRVDVYSKFDRGDEGRLIAS